MKKLLIGFTALIVMLVHTGCGNDVFESNEVKIVPKTYTVAKGDYMDGILGYFYEQNTVFVDWASYRQKHFDLNAELTKNGRFIQPGDKIIVFVVKRKGER